MSEKPTGPPSATGASGQLPAPNWNTEMLTKNLQPNVQRHILLCHNSETLKKKCIFLEKVLTFRKIGLYYIMKLGREKKKKKTFSRNNHKAGDIH
jgi:hypothetical protein